MVLHLAVVTVLTTIMIAPLNALGRPADPAPTATPVQEASGTVWGGEHVEMELTKTGATLEFDCATGTISKPLAPDAQGKFQVSGTLTREGPGPTMREGRPAIPVIYSGSIQGESMHLEIVAANSKDKIDEFDLVRGKPGHLLKCR